MKKLVSLLAVVLFSMTAYAQSVEDALNALAKKEGVQVMNINKDFVEAQIATALSSITDEAKRKEAEKEMRESSDDAMGVLEDIVNLQILTTTDASKAIQEEVKTALQTLNLTGYETLIDVKDEDSDVKIYQEKQADNTYKTLIMIDDKEDHEVVALLLHTYKDLMTFAEDLEKKENGGSNNFISYGNNKSVLDLLKNKK
ncbi:MAG: DUF4252 domain-containing protein [Prevotellaceae bacterium]|nr:DUF4252 domain-containing protein [Prevotellaceae bacterium]